MTGTLPIPPQQSLVIRELITRLRVQDVMSTNISCARRNDSLRTIQQIMKQRGISGVPVVDDGRLYGIVSVDDIIRALDKGHIDEIAEKHMSRNVVFLEENMPLSLAITHFDKYSFGRFPVINKESRLVGIVTSRDILTRLLVEINREVDKLETLLPMAPPAESARFSKQWQVRKYDMDNAGKVSSEVKKRCTELGVDSRTCRRIAVAVYELEINLVVHSEGGQLHCLLSHDSFKVVAQDQGPGIADVDLAMQEGYSTAIDWIKSLGFGAGMGLPNVKRVSDDFEISSQFGVGTRVQAVIHLASEKE